MFRILRALLPNIRQVCIRYIKRSGARPPLPHLELLERLVSAGTVNLGR